MERWRQREREKERENGGGGGGGGTEQIECLMKWVLPGLNKFSGLAIPQDSGLPGRLMTTGPWYNEVVCLGNVLVNSSQCPQVGWSSTTSL